MPLTLDLLKKTTKKVVPTFKSLFLPKLPVAQPKPQVSNAQATANLRQIEANINRPRVAPTGTAAFPSFVASRAPQPLAAPSQVPPSLPQDALPPREAAPLITAGLERTPVRERVAGAGMALQRASKTFEDLQARTLALREQEAAQRQALQAAYAPSEREAQLQRQLADFTSSAEQGIAGLEGQGRGIPLGLVRGQQAKLAEQAALQQGALGRQLEAEQGLREGRVQAAQVGLEGLTAQQAQLVQDAQLAQQAGDIQRQEQVQNLVSQTPGESVTERYAELVNSGQIATSDVPPEILKALLTGTEPVKPITVGAGETLVDPTTGQPIFAAPEKSQDITPYQQAQLGIEMQKLAQGKAPTVDQSKARQFAVAAGDANTVLDTLGYDPGVVEVPLPNVLKSSERQQFEQASRAFINALLRRESGATITDDEFKNKYKELIPLQGEAAGVKEQKARARRAAVQSITEAGGQGFTQGSNEFSW